MQRQIIKIQLLASVLIFLPTLDLSNVYANSENPYANNSNSSFNKSNSSVNSLLTLFKDTGITVGGWFQAGATYNANNPGDGFNGLSVSLIVPIDFN